MYHKNCKQCLKAVNVKDEINTLLEKEFGKDIKNIEEDIYQCWVQRLIEARKYQNNMIRQEILGKEANSFKLQLDLLYKIGSINWVEFKDATLPNDWTGGKVLSEDELKTLIDCFKELSDYDKRFESVVNYLSEINK